MLLRTNNYEYGSELEQRLGSTRHEGEPGTSFLGKLFDQTLK